MNEKQFALMAHPTEKKIITLNSTAIAIYLECPMKYNYASLQCLSLKGAKREAMDKGELMHHLICRWIELRADRDEADKHLWRAGPRVGRFEVFFADHFPRST